MEKFNIDAKLFVPASLSLCAILELGPALILVFTSAPILALASLTNYLHLPNPRGVDRGNPLFMCDDSIGVRHGVEQSFIKLCGLCNNIMVNEYFCGLKFVLYVK